MRRPYIMTIDAGVTETPVNPLFLRALRVLRG